MPVEQPAQRRPLAALLLTLAILLPGLPASPAESDPLGAAGPDRLASCSGTALPRPAGGVASSGGSYSELSRNRICFSSLQVSDPMRVRLRIWPGPTFSGEVLATFSGGSVGGTFVAGQLVSGQATTTLEIPEGDHTLVLFAGYWAAAGQGGESIRPLCFPPIEFPGCLVVVPIPFAWAGAGPIGAAGDVAAEVSLVR